MRRMMIWTGVSCALALGPYAHAGDLGFDWVTIGDPGNRGATYDEAFLNEGRGSVGYEYRLTRTEITVSQHLEFLQAIEPFVPSWDTGPSSRRQWMGDRIGVWPDSGELFAASGWENTGTTMSFYTAARFCNWLHNDQVNEAWAFESGAYDTSTFGQVGPDGQPIDYLTHSEGARFWIPNLDEWIKGMYWDPTKGSEGGYWIYPHMSDEAPVPGAPGEPGAQTSAGLIPINNPKAYIPVDVGSYPEASSFWGLLDGSGGVTEMLEASPGDFLGYMQIAGSDRDAIQFATNADRIFSVGISATPNRWQYGFRIASTVPSPGCCTFVALFVIVSSARRR